MKDKMEKQIQLAFTGYSSTNVRSALNTIIKKSSNFGIVINSTPIQQNGLMATQPQLRGCDKKDLTVYSLAITGSLENVKSLVKTKTPLGVQIDLLPQTA